MHSYVSNFALFILLLLCCLEVYGTKRMKRAHMDNFNVLLNLYKMNPLKNSKLFKTFSNQMLLPMHEDNMSVVKNFESNENTTAMKASDNIKLNQISKMIHTYNTTTRDPSKPEYENPEYNIENVGIEKFTINTIINDVGGNESETKEDFNSVFTHIESGEVNKVSVTKLQYVNITNIITSTHKAEPVMQLPNKSDELPKLPSLSDDGNDNRSRRNFDGDNALNYDEGSNFADAVVIFR